jgi:large subunit ribosomal protein L28
MAKRCDVTKKGVLSGNSVSHAHNKTRRRFLPNIQRLSFFSDMLGRRIRLTVSVNGIRTIEKNGGIDQFLLNTSSKLLERDAVEIQRILKKRFIASKAS